MSDYYMLNLLYYYDYEKVFKVCVNFCILLFSDILLCTTMQYLLLESFIYIVKDWPSVADKAARGVLLCIFTLLVS